MGRYCTDRNACSSSVWPKKLQGFIIGIKDSVDVESKKLKTIHEILDVTPVLNDELLKLGYWLTN